MTGRAARAFILAALLAGCGLPDPSPTPSPVAAVIVPEPGRPFDAETILAAMRDSRRPGGVPDAIETVEIAEGVAEAIWTIDGRPWTRISIGGSCGPATCTLDVAGSRPDMLGEDGWTFSIEPAIGDVSVAGASLGSLPDELADRADRAARDAVGADVLDGMALASVQWLPPPEHGVLILAYRAGDEEQSCRRDVRVDLRSSSTTLETSADC